MRAEIDAALETPFIDARLLTIAERHEIRARVRWGLVHQRWQKNVVPKKGGQPRVSKGFEKLDGYVIRGASERAMNTSSMRGSGWLGANEKMLRIVEKKTLPVVELIE